MLKNKDNRNANFIFSKRLKNILEDRGLTYEYIGGIVGYSPQAVYQWVKNGKVPRTSTLNALADFLGVPQSYLLGYDNDDIVPPSERLATLPVIGEIKAGYPTLAQENILDYEQIPVSWLNNGEYFILRVSGDSMRDVRIMDGDKVLVKVQSCCDNGQIAVVSIANTEITATLKRVFWHDENVELVPENRAYPRMNYPANSVIIRGVVKKVIIDM